MRAIYSRVKPRTLLHMVNRMSEVDSPRQNLTPDEEYLQVAAMKMDKGKTFRPHKHLPLERTTDLTQESWLVIRGRVKAILYDLDDCILEEVVLGPGDCSITFRGGHTYEALEDDTFVYEYKTGPYLGQERDKTFID